MDCRGGEDRYTRRIASYMRYSWALLSTLIFDPSTRRCDWVLLRWSYSTLASRQRASSMSSAVIPVGDVLSSFWTACCGFEFLEHGIHASCDVALFRCMVSYDSVSISSCAHSSEIAKGGECIPETRESLSRKVGLHHLEFIGGPIHETYEVTSVSFLFWCLILTGICLGRLQYPHTNRRNTDFRGHHTLPCSLHRSRRNTREMSTPPLPLIGNLTL
jgi:hypothetical protein